MEKLTKKLEGMESQQATMKAVNAYYRKHKTLEGCPELTAEQVEKVKAAMSQTGAKTPFRFRPICSPTITPTSAVCASALRS